MTDNADQAATESKKHKGRALKTLTLWANSRDGREMLSLAGINPDKRVTDCMVAFAAKGVPPTMSRKKGRQTNDGRKE